LYLLFVGHASLYCYRRNRCHKCYKWHNQYIGGSAFPQQISPRVQTAPDKLLKAKGIHPLPMD